MENNPHDRKPILISKNVCALILLFEKRDELFDVFYDAFDDWDSPEVSRQAAKEFVSQLKGWWTKRFMKALKAEIEDILNDKST